MLIGEVGLDGRRLEGTGELAGPLFAAVIVDDDAGALAGERPRARGADPSGSAGDEHALACETRFHAHVG